MIHAHLQSLGFSLSSATFYFTHNKDDSLYLILAENLMSHSRPFSRFTKLILPKEVGNFLKE